MRPTIRILIAAVAATVASSCGDPSFIEEVTIVNPSEYRVHAEVGDGRGGWLNLGGIQPESEKTIQQVIDMGQRWVFRFSFRGEVEELVESSRSELSGEGWRVEVSEALVEQLRARGDPPSFRG